MINGVLFPPPADGPITRVYLGSQTIMASGTWMKSDALDLPFVSGVNLDRVECVVECIGGGSSGDRGFPTYGGGAGAVAMETLAWAVMPETAVVAIGAGGPLRTSNGFNGGGTTSFGDISSALGGIAGAENARLSDMQSAACKSIPSLYIYMIPGPPPPPDPSYGPGVGARGNGSSSNGTVHHGATGGASGCRRAGTTLEGGAGAVHGVSDAAPGADAITAFQYGSGGGGAVNYSAMPSNRNGGGGGWPGGGGGGGAFYSGVSIGHGGAGGNGAARIHFYEYREA